MIVKSIRPKTHESYFPIWYDQFCCSQEGFFPGSTEDSCFTMDPPAAERTKRSGSISPTLRKSPSGERKRRKKPLAVAVGWNYANDVNGRPIVVTPGGHRMPVSGKRSPSELSGSRHRSPAVSQRPAQGFSTPPRMPTLGPEDNESDRIALKYKSQA